MQMAELLQSGQGASDRVAANSLHALLKKSKKAATLPTADQVEFWRSPEKTGWMYSQGEHIKTWRKRWFVLKQGFLFRFASEDVGPSSKPRGIVDLSQVTDVTDGNSATGRANSIKISTATVSKCYLTDSETAQVEWISALEGSISNIVKIVAGVDEHEERDGTSRRPATLEDQLHRSFSAATGKPSGRSTNGVGRSNGEGSGGGHSSMVEIINYQPAAPSAAPAGHPQAGPIGGYNEDYGGYINVDYGGIAGARMAPPEPEVPTPSAAQFGAYGSIYSGPGPRSFDSAPNISQGVGMYAPNQSYETRPYQYEHHQQSQPIMQSGALPHAAEQVIDHQTHLMDAVTIPSEPPPAPSSPWQTHYTADGRPYYYNSSTGITTWEAPAGGA